MRFKFDSKKLGEQRGKGEYGIIYEYKDQGPEKNHHLVKQIRVKDLDNLMQFIEEFALGFNNNHPFVLNYKGIDIQEVNEDGYKYMVFILMKAQKQSLKELVRERKSEEGKKNYLHFDRVISIFHSLVSALAYLEEKNIMHSNITHDSVLFDKNDTVKLAGFALSLYKPWKIPQKRMYQSYRPTDRTKSQGEKSIAFKPDVWCLGKLIIDICLLQDEVCWENDKKEAYQKIKADLKEVEEIYHNKNLIKILKGLLDPKPENRPSFKDIRDNLEKTYEGLIEMKNEKKEESNLDVSISSIQSEKEPSRLETTFQETLLRNIEESKEEFKEALQTTQQDIQSMINTYKKISSQSFEEIKTRVKAITNCQIEDLHISRESIDKFRIQAKEYLSSYKECFKALKPKYKELRQACQKMNFPSEKIVSKQMVRPSIFHPVNISKSLINQENASTLLYQGIPEESSQEVENLLLIKAPYYGITGQSDSFFDADIKEKDSSEKEGELLKE